MREVIDLDAYLRRIGHAGAVAARLSTLRALAVAHEPFRLMVNSEDGDWRMQALVRGQWSTL